MKKALIRHFPSHAAMSRAAAAHAARILSAAVRENGRAAIVLSGGATPELAYEILAGDAVGVPWSGVLFFWADERCVSPESPASNYGLARRMLLSRIAADPSKTYRIPVELGWRKSARSYEALLRELFADRPRGGKPCFFDLALLGVGQDGHTASLFPGSAAMESSCWVASVEAPAGVRPRRRVTMTAGLLAKAREILFLAGEEKREIVRRVFETSVQGRGDYPAGRIQPREKLRVFVADGR